MDFDFETDYLEFIWIFLSFIYLSYCVTYSVILILNQIYIICLEVSIYLMKSSCIHVIILMLDNNLIHNQN